MDSPEKPPAILQACKLCAFLTLTLFFLPSLFLSLLFSFFLFLPITCTLLLSAILSRAPFQLETSNLSVGNFLRIVSWVFFGDSTKKHSDVWKGNGGGGGGDSLPECIEFDRSKVPPFDETSEEDGEEGKVREDLAAPAPAADGDDDINHWEEMSFWERCGFNHPTPIQSSADNTGVCY